MVSPRLLPPNTQLTLCFCFSVRQHATNVDTVDLLTCVFAISSSISLI
jgi:hypothetical protein